jgi:hypothetical protein
MQSEKPGEKKLKDQSAEFDTAKSTVSICPAMWWLVIAARRLILRRHFFILQDRGSILPVRGLECRLFHIRPLKTFLHLYDWSLR